MRKRNTLGGNVGQSEEYLYAAPVDRRQVDYPGASQRSGEELNQFRDKFQEQLEGAARERSTAVFNGERSITEFKAEERAEIVQDWISGFNAMQFADNKERRATALEVAASVFKPIYQRAELEEFRSQIDPVVFKELQSQGVEDVRFKNNGPGAGEIIIEVSSNEKAKNILRKSGERAYAVEAEKLHAYEWDFSKALFHSDKEPENSAWSMNEILDAAIAYATGTNKEPVRHEVENPIEAPKQDFEEGFEGGLEHLRTRANYSEPYLDDLKETWELAVSGNQPENEPAEMDQSEQEQLWRKMTNDPGLQEKVELLIEDAAGELQYTPSKERLEELVAEHTPMWDIIKRLYQQAEHEHPVMGIESLPGHDWTNQVKLMKYIRDNEALQAEIKALIEREEATKPQGPAALG